MIAAVNNADARPLTPPVRCRLRVLQKGGDVALALLNSSNMTQRTPSSLSLLQQESTASAQAAGLRYFVDIHPGIRRLRRGTNFSYQGVDGRLIRDPAILRRIKSLVFPPAWADVWICPDTEGHLQATGRDSKGRKQYRYHPRWRIIRDETKYDRLLPFAQQLPRIRQQVERDVALPGLPRDKVLATVVHLLDTT